MPRRTSYVSMSASRDARPSRADPTGRARTSRPCRSSSAATRAFKTGWTRSHTESERACGSADQISLNEATLVGAHEPWPRRQRTLPAPGRGSRFAVVHRPRSCCRCQTGPSSGCLRAPVPSMLVFGESARAGARPGEAGGSRTQEWCLAEQRDGWRLRLAVVVSIDLTTPHPAPPEKQGSANNSARPSGRFSGVCRPQRRRRRLPCRREQWTRSRRRALGTPPGPSRDCSTGVPSAHYDAARGTRHRARDIGHAT